MTSLLVASLSSGTQDARLAREVAASYASYGLTHFKWADSAEVRLEVEMLPRLSRAATDRPEWLPLSTYYFKR